MEEKDYKKLYEDVLERAKNGLKDKNYYLSQSAKEVTEFLFPQLKETEDEKVKRELTRFLINFNNGYYSKPSENEIDSWIKWIDKKCEQNHTDEVKPKFNVGDWIVYEGLGTYKVVEIHEGWYSVIDSNDRRWSVMFEKESLCHLWTIQDANDGDVLYFSDETIVIFKDLYNATTFHSYCHIEYGLFVVKDDMPDWWEGKGFQPATKEQRDLLFQKMKENGYEWDAEKKELNKIEKQGEQNPTDKVEPKFKVGDWVVYNRDDYSREIIQVYDIRDGRYYFTDNIHFSWSIKECDEKCHLWTIQDANDGDVLATKKGNPFIYDKDRYNNGLAYYYAGLDVNKELTLKSPHHMLAHFGELCSIFPATKEQRDLLFQKMKEAGYKWDAENKKLNKIEQESTWNEKIKGLNELETYILSLVPDRSLDAIKVDAKNIRYIINKEQKPAEWSEKDAKILNEIIDELTPYGECPDYPSPEEQEYYYTRTSMIDWLKSLKDRVQPQSQQEWSKEDSERLLRIHQFIWANRKGDTDEIYQQEQDADWLMSIIPQQNQYDKGYNDGYSAAKYNQWKPTDKQMEDFRMLLDYNIGVFDYAKFMSADSLYEDLKKNLIDE